MTTLSTADPRYRSFRRMSLRNMGLVVRALEPPREVKFEQNLLTWKPPEDIAGITHYRIRIEKDTGAPDFEVSSGQLALQLFRGDTFAISSYNKTADLESRPVIVGGDYSLSSGNVGLGLAGSQGLTINAVNATLTDPTDFGMRFWVIAITYMASIEGLVKVEIWVENPSGEQPEKIGESTYVAAGDHIAYFAMDPPESATTLRVYLVPVTTGMVYPLLSVAEYGEGASANDTVQITPVPTDDLGVEVCENVSSWDVTTPSDFYDANGVKRIQFKATFTKPSDARWGGVWIVVKKPGGRYVHFGPFYDSPTQDVEVPLPIVEESWRVFGQSQDKFGKRNSINESEEGTKTPYEDVDVGITVGALDLGKALDTSISSALSVVANVLGVAGEGITESLIKDFAISQVKLKNAQIIDAARIVDAAVTTAKIDNLAVTNALIANGAVTNLKIGDAEIYGAKIKNAAINDAHIGTLSVSSISSWSGASVSITSDFTFAGTAGLVVSAGGGIHCNGILYGGTIIAGSGSYVQTPNIVDTWPSPTVQAALGGGWFQVTPGNIAGTIIRATSKFQINTTDVINSSFAFIGSGGVNTAGNIAGANLKYSGQFWAPYSSESIDLSTITIAKWIAAYDTAGNYLGKIPIIP